jgi:cobalt/nickel transport system permease protein
MHIPDGILTGPMIIMWYLIAVIFIFVGARIIVKKRKENPQVMSILALMGAAVFIISVWHIPVGPSSGHPTGTGLAAIIVGPFATVVVTVIALFFQVFLAHGGITTLGANTVSMGVVGAFSGYAIYWFARKAHASVWLAAGLAGFASDLLIYATTAFQLALNQSYHVYQNPNYLLPYFTLYMVEFSVVQVPIAIAEGIFTAIAIQYIATHKPEILKWWRK